MWHGGGKPRRHRPPPPRRPARRAGARGPADENRIPEFSDQEALGLRLGRPPGSSHHVAHRAGRDPGDRKSTRLNSSHSQISYAVFCLKKKKTKTLQNLTEDDTVEILKSRYSCAS